MSSIDLSTRPTPSLGGLNPTLIKLELKRLARNQRTMIFTIAFPVVMFLAVSSSIRGGRQPIAPGFEANTVAYVMVSMALYGAVVASISAGASVASERALGWSRQLRLTPLSPLAYILVKMATAMIMGAVALTATFVAGEWFGGAAMAGISWALAAAIVVCGSLVFAALGLFVGYLLPSNSNAMGILGPLTALLGFLGGLFQGPIDTSTLMGKVQSYTPIYGLNQIAHWPLTHSTDGNFGHFDVGWAVNLLAWGALFVAGAVWRFRKDTARV